MPNHVTNRLHINGAPEKVAEVRDAIRGVWEESPERPRPIDFNKILPMPDGLEVQANTGEVALGKKEAGVKDRDTEFMMDWHRRGAEHIDDAKVDQVKNNVERTGYAYWRDWAVDHWGTKWNAYSQNEIDLNLIVFDTAWSCPIPVLKALAAKFPEVEFVCEFADEDIGANQGTLTFRKGELVERTEAQGNKNRRMFAYRVKGYGQKEIKEREQDYAEYLEEEGLTDG